MLFTAGITFGQVKQVSDTKNYTLNNDQVFYVNGKTKTILTNDKAGGDVIYNETFSSMGSWTSTGVDAALWMYDTDGPNGQYSNPATQIITSTTASDGFMIFDADFSNPAGVTPVNRIGSLVSPAYDLSLNPNVLVSFEQSYRHCCSRDFILTMDVSNDNFTTFSTYDISVPGIAVNDNSGTVKTVVNINDFIATGGTLSNFQVRFNFDGSVGTTHYFWQIDDFQLIEQHPHDLSITNAWIGDIVTDFEVTEIPAFFNKDIIMQASLRSFGSATPSNVKLRINVLDATSTSVFTAEGGTLSNNFAMVYDTVTFITGLNTSKLAAGTYTVNMDIIFTETDGDLTNNSFSRTLMITGSTLSSINYDGNVYRDNIAYSYRNTTTNDVPFMRVGTLFTLPSTVSPLFMTGIDIGLSTGPASALTSTGEKIFVSIYEYDFNAATFAESFIPFSDEFEFTIAAPMLNSTGDTYTFNFSASENGTTNNPVLDPGKSYVATFVHYGGSAKYLWYWASKFDEDISSFTFGPFGVNAAENWFTLGNDPLMRMNLAQGVGLNELAKNTASVQVYPNPATDIITVDFVLNQTSDVSINITDVTGKVINAGTNLSGKKGANSTSISTTNFDAGVYFVNVNLNNEIIIKKITIK